MSVEVNIDNLHPVAEELQLTSERQRKEAGYLGMASIATSLAAAGTLSVLGDHPPSPEAGVSPFLFDTALRYGPALLALGTELSAGGKYVLAIKNRALASVIDTSEFEHGTEILYGSVPDIVRSLPLLPDQIDTLMNNTGARIGIQAQVADGITYVITQGENPNEWKLETGRSGKNVRGTEYGYVNEKYTPDDSVSVGEESVRLVNNQRFGYGFSYQSETFAQAMMKKKFNSAEIVHPVEYKSRAEFYDKLTVLCTALTAEHESILTAFSGMLVDYRLAVGSGESNAEKLSKLFHDHYLTLHQINESYQEGELNDADAENVRSGFRHLFGEIPLSSLVFVAPNILQDALSGEEKAAIRESTSKAQDRMHEDKSEWDRHKGDTETYWDTEVYTETVDGKTQVKTRQVMKTRLTDYAEQCLRNLRDLRPQLEAINTILQVVAA